MSVMHITRPMSLTTLLSVAGKDGWTPVTRNGSTALVRGDDSVLIEGQFTASDGSIRVMFTQFGSSVVDSLTKATRAIDQYRPGFERLMNDGARRNLGWM